MTLDKEFNSFLGVLKNKSEFEKLISQETKFKALYETENESLWQSSMYFMSGGYYYLGKNNLFQGYMNIEDKKLIGRSYEPGQFMDCSILFGIFNDEMKELYFVKIYPNHMAVPIYYHAIKGEDGIYDAIWNSNCKDVIAPINDCGNFMINTNPETDGTANFFLARKDKQ